MSAVKNSNVAPSNPPSSKKRSGGFLRQAKSRKDHPGDLEPVTEDELSMKESISPEDVLRLQKITESKYASFPDLYGTRGSSGILPMVRYVAARGGPAVSLLQRREKQ